MENLFYYTVFTVPEEIWYNVSTYSSTMNIRGSEMHACMFLRARMFMSRTRTDHILNGIKKEGEV